MCHRNGASSRARHSNYRGSEYIIITFVGLARFGRRNGPPSPPSQHRKRVLRLILRPSCLLLLFPNWLRGMLCGLAQELATQPVVVLAFVLAEPQGPQSQDRLGSGFVLPARRDSIPFTRWLNSFSPASAIPEPIRGSDPNGFWQITDSGTSFTVGTDYWYGCTAESELYVGGRGSEAIDGTTVPHSGHRSGVARRS
jgi:hypothetical protein